MAADKSKENAPKYSSREFDGPLSVALSPVTNSESKHQSTVREKTTSAKSIGAGFMGSVFSPILPCQDEGLDREVQAISKKTPLVLKLTELAMGLTAVHTSNFIRDRWEKVRRQKYHSSMAPSVWQLLGEVRSRQPEEFFVLTLSQVCSNCMTPDGKQPINSSGAMVGIYMPNAGKKWTDVLPPGSPLARKEIKILKNTVCAVLLLHGMGITHNDIRRANITIDADLTPRLIDWELRSRPNLHAAKTLGGSKEDGGDGSDGGGDLEGGVGLYVDELPDDRRWYQSFVHGFFSTPDDLIRLDWLALHRVFSLTWAKNIDLHPPKYAKLLSQTLSLLNAGTDKSALLAWTLLQHAD